MNNTIVENIGIVEQKDPKIARVLSLELKRQQNNLELIASENLVSPEVMATMGSVLTNKYAEGYPGRRHYGGCEFVDICGAHLHRAREGDLLRRFRKRAGSQRIPGKLLCLSGSLQARRYGPRHGPPQRRPSDPRKQGELLREDVQYRILRR